MPDVAWRRRERSLPHLVHAPEGLMDYLHWNRLEKTAYEIACMILATRKAALGHHAARDAFENSNPGDGKISEGSILSAYLAGAGISESDSPYQPIVAFGPDGAILHYFRPNYGVTAGSTLLIDAGVIIGCDAQKAAELGLAAAFIIHSVGHSIGAHVHDEGLLQVDPSGKSPPMPTDPVLVGSGYNRPRGTLGECYAMTVEPGIYFDGTLRERLKAHEQKAGGVVTGSVDCINWRLIDRLVLDGGMRLETNVVTLPGGENVDITRRYLPEMTNVV